jgi:hypothetical protein
MMRASVVAGIALLLAGLAGADDKKPEPAGSIHLEIKGTLKTGIIAVGGETTGVEISTKGGFRCEVAGKVDEKLNGKTVIATGSFAIKPGVELRQRSILTADKVVEATEKPDENHVKAVIKGTVMTPVLAPGGVTTGIQISAAGAVWELDATGDKKLLETLRASNGKDLEVTGTVEVKKVATSPRMRTIVTVTGVK